MPTLRILNGPAAGRTCEVGDGASIGRAAECTLVLSDASISRRHAGIVREGAGWIVRDEGSRNGLWHADARVAQLRLAPDAEFRLGEVRLQWVADAQAAQPAPVELEEIELDELDPAELDPVELDAVELDPVDLDPEPFAPVTLRTKQTPAAAPLPAAAQVRSARDARQPERASAAATRGILQYKKVEQREGLASSDLSQLPLWLKLVAALVAAALFVGLFWTAFRGTAWLKGGAASSAEAPLDAGAPQDG